MLLTRTSCLIINFVLVVQLAVPTSSKIVHLEEKLSIIEAFVSHAHKQLNIPEIAVGIVADGKTVFQKGYGLHNSEDIHGGSPVTPRTLFGIGSCSKPFTTYALDRLVNEDGILAWNDLVLSHVFEFRLSNVFTMDRIQVRDLVTHVSGLPGHKFVLPYNQTLPRSQLFSLIAELCTNYELREKFQYNNLLFWVASVVLERLTLEVWTDAIRSLVFKPLNLTLTFPSIDEAAKYREDRINIEHAEVVQIVGPQKVSKNGSAKHTSCAHVKNMAPSGSIYSCVEDMIKWIHAQLALSESAKAMHDPQVVVPRGSFVVDLDGGETFAYGLGWMLARHRGQRLVWCGGPFDAFISRLILCPEKNLGVVILMSPDERPLGRIVHNLVLQIVDTLTMDDSHVETLDPVEWAKQQMNTFLNVPVAKTELKLNCSDCFEEKKWIVDKLEEYAGVFQHDAYGTVVVRVDKAQLIATRDTQNFVLKPGAAADFFRAHSDDGFIFTTSFKRDSVGDVAQFFINLEPTCEPIPFGKIPNEDFFVDQYVEPFCGVYENAGSFVQIKITKTMSSAESPRALLLLADGSSKYTGLLTPRSLLWFRLKDDVLFKFVKDLNSGQVIELHVYDEDYEEAIIFKKTSM